MTQVFPAFDQTIKKNALPENPTFDEVATYIWSFCPITHPRYVRDENDQAFALFEINDDVKVEFVTNYCDRDCWGWRFTLNVWDVFRIARHLKVSEFVSRGDVDKLPYEQIQGVMELIRKYDRNPPKRD